MLQLTVLPSCDGIVHLQTVLGIILGGGAGTRLYPLTKKRAKPAVPLGANYRLIDIPVSNCVNSNVTKIYCLTQFNSASLNRHLSQAYVSRESKFTLAQNTARSKIGASCFLLLFGCTELAEGDVRFDGGLQLWLLCNEQ